MEPSIDLADDALAEEQIEAIQASGYKAAIVVSGGGIGAVNALLLHPGASRFILEAQVPYSPEAMFDYLGEKMPQFCCAEAAATMAGRAFERALIFSLSDHAQDPIVGIACTAALQTNRKRKGSDRAFISLKSRKAELVREVKLPQGSRSEQDAALSREFLNFIAEHVAGNKV